VGDVYSSEFSEVDDDNDSASGAGWPESMRPGNVNNAARALQGAIKRFVDQQTPKTTTGTSTAYLLTYAVAPSALADGMTFLVAFDKGCGNAPTLNVNSLGAKALYKFSGSDWVALVAGDILANQILRVSYDDASGTFRVLQPLNVVPAGATLGFRGVTVPTGWLLEDGKSIGDASSGATALASAAAEALFKVLWANDVYVIQDSTGAASSRGATADADWAAHKRMILTDMGSRTRYGYKSGVTAGPGGTGGSSSLQSGATSGSLSVSVSGSGTTAGSNGFPTRTSSGAGSDNGFSAGNHTHNFSVTSTGSTSGTLTVTGTVTPPYVVELSIIKL
jgi:hypothetical protein